MLRAEKKNQIINIQCHLHTDVNIFWSQYFRLNRNWIIDVPKLLCLDDSHIKSAQNLSPSFKECCSGTASVLYMPLCCSSVLPIYCEFLKLIQKGLCTYIYKHIYVFVPYYCTWSFSKGMVYMAKQIHGVCIYCKWRSIKLLLSTSHNLECLRKNFTTWYQNHEVTSSKSWWTVSFFVFLSWSRVLISETFGLRLP